MAAGRRLRAAIEALQEELEDSDVDTVLNDRTLHDHLFMVLQAARDGNDAARHFAEFFWGRLLTEWTYDRQLRVTLGRMFETAKAGNNELLLFSRDLFEFVLGTWIHQDTPSGDFDFGFTDTTSHTNRYIRFGGPLPWQFPANVQTRFYETAVRAASVTFAILHYSCNYLLWDMFELALTNLVSRTDLDNAEDMVFARTLAGIITDIPLLDILPRTATFFFSVFLRCPGVREHPENVSEITNLMHDIVSQPRILDPRMDLYAAYIRSQERAELERLYPTHSAEGLAAHYGSGVDLQALEGAGGRIGPAALSMAISRHENAVSQQYGSVDESEDMIREILRRGVSPLETNIGGTSSWTRVMQGFNERVRRMMLSTPSAGTHWAMATRHRTRSPEIERAILTVLLCARRLQPQLPSEIWMIVFENLRLRDFYPRQ